MPNIPLGPDDDEPTAEPAKRSHTRKTTSTPRRRARERPARASLETRIRESLEAVADWLRDRGDAELGGVLHSDAPKMAAVLGRLAKLNPLAGKAVGVVADALEPVRAFGPTLRVLWRRLVHRRELALTEREEAEEEMLTSTLARGQGDGTPPSGVREQPAEVAEPWRLG